MATEDLDADDRARVGEYWWRRAAGEMTSWVGWQHVLDDLEIEGSPAPVLELAQRAVADEHRHAVWCREWAERFGHEGGEVRPRGERRFELVRASDAENRLARIALCCFTETVGCCTLQQVRKVVQDPDLRKLNQRHLIRTGAPLACDPAEWRCNDEGSACASPTSTTAYEQNCVCDATLPHSKADCGPSAFLVCRRVMDPAGRFFPIDCRCVSQNSGEADANGGGNEAAPGCSLCNLAYGSRDYWRYQCTLPGSDDGGPVVGPDVLCGCSVIYLQ